jgi:hypothetical protein
VGVSPVLNLIFPDGSIVTGRTYQELEEALRATQWRPYKSRRAFRRDMRRRAENWSGRPAKPILYQTPKAFIHTLVNSGMCMLEEGILNSTTNHQEMS